MRMMRCEDCGDIVTCYPMPLRPRPCMCQRHWIWRDKDRPMQLYFHDATGLLRPSGEPEVPRAYVVYIGNRLLNDKADSTSRQLVEETLATTDLDHFRRTGSLVYKVRPQLTNSVGWAAGFPDPPDEPWQPPAAGIAWRDA